MSVIAAVNFEDRLVMLEDGRELQITQYYSSLDPRHPLTAKDELRTEHRIDNWRDADVFVAEFPGAGTFLIVEMSALRTATPSQIN